MYKSVTKIFGLLILGLMFSSSINAQSPAEKEVAAKVDELKELLINPDKAKLEKIAANDLTYGHSSGVIESKEKFIDALVSGQSNFVDITISGQTITIVDHTAIVRHKLSARLEDPGKAPASVNLSILLVWVKQNGQWKLLARQAVRA